MAYTVYVLRDRDGKVYVGVTSTPVEVRWNNGNGYRFCEALWEKIQSQGWDTIAKEIVATDLDEKSASELERALIVRFGSTNPTKGYNTDLGGVKGYRLVSQASRARMSESKMGDLNHNYGKHFSEEHKQKIAKSNRGHKRTQETRRNIGKAKEKPVLQITLEGSVIARFDSGKQASLITGVQSGHISKVCKHQRSTAGGFVWVYA